MSKEKRNAKANIIKKKKKKKKISRKKRLPYNEKMINEK